MKTLIRFNDEYIQFFDYSEYKIAEYSRTNVLDLSELVLSDSFISENYNFIYNFVKNKILKDNLTKVFIDKVNISPLAFKLINNISTINYIYINENKKIDTDVFKFLLTNKNIKTINCYDVSFETFDRLNLSRKINIITRKQEFRGSYLYESNEIFSQSDIYYAKNLTITRNSSEDDFDNIEYFLKINRSLKTVDIKYFEAKQLNKLLQLLAKYQKRHIIITIYENDNNIKKILKTFSSIKNRNKRLITKNKIKLKIIYEDKYIKKNLFKELNLNFLKTNLLAIIFITSSIFILLYFINQNKTNEIMHTNDEIKEIINNVEQEANKNKDKKQEPVNDIKTEKPKKTSAYFKNYSKALSELKKINKDTVGWLSINNTSIHYPVVQSNNNNKYLTKSFDGSTNLNGWIFMDFKNHPNNLDQNTVLYGHSGNYYVMFGSLHKVLNKAWYKNPKNQTIVFNTNKNHTWKIFSIYTINNTNDYINTRFNNDTKYMNFLTKIKKRSIYDFGVNVNTNDKILTLSTCYKSSKKRLVIHAKLIS